MFFEGSGITTANLHTMKPDSLINTGLLSFSNNSPRGSNEQVNGIIFAKTFSRNDGIICRNYTVLLPNTIWNGNGCISAGENGAIGLGTIYDNSVLLIISDTSLLGNQNIYLEGRPALLYISGNCNGIPKVANYGYDSAIPLTVNMENRSYDFTTGILSITDKDSRDYKQSVYIGKVMT